MFIFLQIRPPPSFTHTGTRFPSTAIILPWTHHAAATGPDCLNLTYLDACFLCRSPGATSRYSDLDSRAGFRSRGRLRNRTNEQVESFGSAGRPLRATHVRRLHAGE